ncbi:hypothetical protein D6745_02020 [Candidatus Woesearchaeota archaeon]|nr:MAG: hypothetical protein D6745_02020 [Candidatus Woesearchaeota archaeon]
MRRDVSILIIITLITLASRLFMAFQTSEFSDDGSYFVLRQVESIREKGKLLYEDRLSFGGREINLNPFYYYFLAFFTFFMPVKTAGKIIPNILASLLVPIIYLLSYNLTRNRHLSLFAAFISGFIPILFRESFNSVSPLSLVLPLMFLTLYLVMKLPENNKFAAITIILMFFLIGTSAASFILMAALVFYVVLCKLEKIKIEKSEAEIIIFFVLLTFWSQFLFYKKAFLMQGTSIIWRNIPLSLLSNYFSQFKILNAIYAIGLIPFFCGVYVIYRFLFNLKSKKLYLLISFFITILIFLWFRLVELKSGLVYMGITLVVLFTVFLKITNQFIMKTKFAAYQSYFFFFLIAIFVVTSLIPSFSMASQKLEEAPASSEVKAYEWLGKNTPEGSTILTTLEEGHLLTYFGRRKNVADTNFLLINNPGQRLEDIKKMYTTPFLTEAISLMNKYNISYVFFSYKAKDSFGIEELKYLDPDCFEKVYSQGVIIYRVLCKIEKV